MKNYILRAGIILTAAFTSMIVGVMLAKWTDVNLYGVGGILVGYLFILFGRKWVYRGEA